VRNDISASFQYLQTNKIVSLVAFYMGISVLLESMFEMDICIPCLWKTFFDFECPGCGLTTALVKILQLDLIAAYQSNMLIFVVIPAGIYYVLCDYNKFRLQNNLQ